MLPKMLPKSTRLGMPERIRSAAHLKWVRQHACCVPECRHIEIQAHHVRIGTQTGLGHKPGDDKAISLCAPHHGELHRIGEPRFMARHHLCLTDLHIEFASKSPVLRRRKRG